MKRTSQPTPCSGNFRYACVDIARFFLPVGKVGLDDLMGGEQLAPVDDQNVGHGRHLAPITSPGEMIPPAGKPTGTKRATLLTQSSLCCFSELLVVC
jgi:hypothetical protein